MNKIFTFILAFCFAVTASAIPAKRGFRVVTNPDGTTLSVELRGDESFHYYVTADGSPIRQNDEGVWEADSRDVKQMWEKALSKRNIHRAENAVKTRRAMKAQRRADEAVVTKKGLLILVEFLDKKFANSDEKTKAIFEQQLNGLNNPYGRNNGSVREYFRDQSYGKLDIHFDVVGPITLSQNMKYYGEDDGEEGADKRPGQMVKEALNQIRDQVNLADYDWDGDKTVENIYITYAGYGQASGGSSNTIWPHQWTLREATNSVYRYNGITIDTYACGSELAGASGKTIDGIGTMCHEYSHCLGLPDFYDTDASDGSNCGMSEWSILDYGCYNGDGFCPAGYTSYERWFCGWLEPVELKEACKVTGMKAIEDEPEAYVIYNDRNRKEYYLLENHQLKGWDVKAFGHGMLVLHVDYDENAWYDNTVNNVESHQRMTFIPADNNFKSGSFSYFKANGGDTYPGSSNNRSLTDTSVPAATLFNANTDGKKFMHKSVEDISEVSGLISFTFMGGIPPLKKPEALEASEIESEMFTANWNAVERATAYDLSLTELYDDGEEEVENPLLQVMSLYEDFEKFRVVGEYVLTDGTSDISDKLDEYTKTPGWAGQKVFQGVFGVKLGSVMRYGTLTTPTLDNSTGEVTVYLDAYDWFNYKNYVEVGNYQRDGTVLEVALVGVDGIVEKQSVEAVDMTSLEEGEYPSIVVHFTAVPEHYSILLSTPKQQWKRVYIGMLMVFDGNYTLEQINTLFDESTGHVVARQLRRAPFRKRVTQTTLYEAIEATSTLLTNLRSGATYTYRVRAIDADGTKSDWSNAISVTLPLDDDRINATRSDASPSGILYDLSGRRVKTNQLSRGIYVREGRKFYVK